jgi:hypothetical protein
LDIGLVYPRNLVGHTDLLASHGSEGYRTARRRSRAASLLSEFNVFEAPERTPAVTGARATRLLQRAAANDGVVHYWLHPENIASAPSTLRLLKMLVREVARVRDAGHCEVMTQLSYCRWVNR